MKQPRHFSLLHLLLVTVVSFGVGVAGYFASTIVLAHDGDVNLVHSCVRNNNGTIRIIGENDTCNGNETPLDWPKTAASGGSSDFVCSQCTPRDLLLRLNQANLQGANLDKAILNQILVQNTDFTGASFVEAVLANAQGESANFSNANFTNANLRSFNALYANLSGANLSGADVYFASFFGANMTNTNLTNVIWESTTCPDGTNSNNNGDTCEGHL